YLWYPLRRRCPARRRRRTPTAPQRARTYRLPHHHQSDLYRAVAAATNRRHNIQLLNTSLRTVTVIESAKKERRRWLGVSEEAEDAEKVKHTRLEATNPEGTPCPKNTTERKDSTE